VDSDSDERKAIRRLLSGAHDWNRTSDLFLTKEVLYRLSYMSTFRQTGKSMERETGIEPAPSAWKAEVLPLNYSRPAGTNVVEGGGFEPPKA
jgi:hypothetical protein